MSAAPNPWIDRLQYLDAAALCDACKTIRVMDPGIRPIGGRTKMVGVARTVRCRDDFLTVIQALDEAREGEVIVVDAGGGYRAVSGELFSTEARRKGLAGIVIDGACRDTGAIEQMDFSFYARFISPMAGTTSRVYETQVPVSCGGVAVMPGDLVLGDRDGIVVMSPDEMAAILDNAEAIQKVEQRAMEKMARGESLIGMLNFHEHLAYRREGRDSTLRFTI